MPFPATSESPFRSEIRRDFRQHAAKLCASVAVFDGERRNGSRLGCSSNRRGHCWRSIAALALLLVLPGCVHRRATIRTDPPGAQVLVGDREIGYSPASFDFTWYGTEEVTLRKDGYEIETHYVKIPRPWYQVPPLDFVFDNFAPGRIKDRHDFHFKLRPRQLVPANQLLERGNALRSEAQLTQ